MSTFISGGDDWTSISKNIPEGVHHLTWIYEKNGLNSEIAKAGYLDQVQMSNTSNDSGREDSSGGGGSAGFFMLLHLLVVVFIRSGKVSTESKKFNEYR
jgi:hypothetical protein